MKRFFIKASKEFFILSLPCRFEAEPVMLGTAGPNNQSIKPYDGGEK